MPHYSDGTPAEVGDIVVGTTYNKPGRIIGMLAAITSQTSDTCNCNVKVFVRDYGKTRVVESELDYSECKVLTKVL